MLTLRPLLLSDDISFILCYLVLKILHGLWIKDILLVKDSMTELCAVNGLGKETLNTVLNDWHGENLVDIWSRFLVCV